MLPHLDPRILIAYWRTSSIVRWVLLPERIQIGCFVIVSPDLRQVQFQRVDKVVSQETFEINQDVRLRNQLGTRPRVRRELFRSMLLEHKC